ncbi:MAG: YihA family ribosome biogenesis GTP-binding protein [Clostridia bacterium]|nr:YihA family ribosome biogenesis GTP-binding protein [Clostridia bacterium]
MNFHNAEFVISAVNESQYPKGNLPEIAMVGRSNVGKSSLINKVLNRKNFARASSKPGKTTTINFYNIDKKINIVDLPGYGYAKVSKNEKLSWANMINHYLEGRQQLKTIFLLIDARHTPTEDDLMMIDWIEHYQIDYYVIATKTDKLKPSLRKQQLDEILNILEIDDKKFITFSAQTGENKDNILKIFSSFE